MVSIRSNATSATHSHSLNERAKGNDQAAGITHGVCSGLRSERHGAFPPQQHMIGYARPMALLRSGPRGNSRTYVHRVSMTFLRSFRRFIADFRWALLGFAAVIAFTLGWLGYTEYLNELYTEGAIKHPPQPTDIAYSTFKLFLMGSPGTTGLPVKIEIARILAPVVSGWAALSGLALLFHDRFQQLRIPLMRGHVVICGLGYVGSLFGEHLRQAGHQVVVVESDPANPLLKCCRRWRSPVIVGDARLESTLREAGVPACGPTSRGVPDRCGEHRDRRRRATTSDRPSTSVSCDVWLESVTRSCAGCCGSRRPTPRMVPYRHWTSSTLTRSARSCASTSSPSRPRTASRTSSSVALMRWEHGW